MSHNRGCVAHDGARVFCADINLGAAEDHFKICRDAMPDELMERTSG